MCRGPQRMRGLGPRLWPRAMGSGLEQDRSTSVLTTLSGLDPRVRAGRECLGPRNFGVGFGFTELLRSDVASRRKSSLSSKNHSSNMRQIPAVEEASPAAALPRGP